MKRYCDNQWLNIKICRMSDFNMSTRKVVLVKLLLLTVIISSIKVPFQLNFLMPLY